MLSSDALCETISPTGKKFKVIDADNNVLEFTSDYAMALAAFFFDW